MKGQDRQGCYRRSSWRSRAGCIADWWRETSSRLQAGQRISFIDVVAYGYAELAQLGREGGVPAGLLRAQLTWMCR